MRYILLASFLLFTSCQVSSKFAMEGSGGRNSYNTAIQMTNSQQMLLNLVRLKYVDIPLFLEVSGVTTQFTYKSKISPIAPIPGFNEENPFLLGGELSWQDQPTISYVPLEGKSFTSRLLSPIQLSTIQQLVYSGWEIDRIFLIMLQNFDELYNAPEVSGPLPEKVPRFQAFNEAIDILHYFQRRGELQIGVKIGQEKGEDTFSLPDQSMQIAVPDEGPKAKRLYELIPHAKNHGGKVVLTLDLGFNERGKLGIMPRNILSCMYYLSQGVCAPDNHFENGLVKTLQEEEAGECDEMHSALSQIFNVKCSFFFPKDAFIAVKYRNYWYYIEDTDLSSKKTFALLLQLYNLHAEESRSIGPILTLPLR